MKLYNIYKSLILESISDKIDTAIKGGVGGNGRPFNVWVNIWYQKKKGGPTKKKFCFIIGRGNLAAGENHDAIRIWDPAYDKSKKNFKTLLVSKITNIEPTKLRQWSPDEFDDYVKYSGKPPYDKKMLNGKYNGDLYVKLWNSEEAKKNREVSKNNNVDLEDNE